MLSRREWRSAGLTSHGFFLSFLFFSLSLYSRFPCSFCSRPGLCSSRRQSDHADLCEGLPDCKGNRANVSRPRGGAYTRFAKLLINAHGKSFLFLSNPPALSPSFSLFLCIAPCIPRLYDRRESGLGWPVQSSACCNTRARLGSFSHDVFL